MMALVDELLCSANEAQLRNVLALAARSMSDDELVALFCKEADMSTEESES